MAMPNQLMQSQQRQQNQISPLQQLMQQYGPQAQQQQAQFNPWSFALGPAAGLASYFAPQQTSDFASGLKNFFLGGDESQFNPEQLSVLQYLLGNGAQQLQNPYEGFQDIENYANQNFQQNVLPGIAERFAGSGNNALSSPVLAQQYGQAGALSSAGLGGLRAQYGQQNKQNALQQLSMGLQPQSQFQPGLFNGNTLGNLGQAAGKLAPLALGAL